MDKGTFCATVQRHNLLTLKQFDHRMISLYWLAKYLAAGYSILSAVLYNIIFLHFLFQ